MWITCLKSYFVCLHVVFVCRCMQGHTETTARLPGKPQRCYCLHLPNWGPRYMIQLSTLVLAIQSQVLMLAEQAFYWFSSLRLIKVILRGKDRNQVRYTRHSIQHTQHTHTCSCVYLSQIFMKKEEPRIMRYTLNPRTQETREGDLYEWEASLTYTASSRTVKTNSENLSH